MSMIAHISRKASVSGATGKRRHTRNAWVLRRVYQYVPTQIQALSKTVDVYSA